MVNLAPALACRVCGHVGTPTLYRAREMMFGTRETFEYFQCSFCSCLQILNFPRDLVRYYPPNYYSFRVPQFPKANALYSLLQKQRTKTALFGTGIKLSRLASRFVDFPLELHECGPLLQRAKITNFQIAALDVGCGIESWWLNGLKALGFRNLLGIDAFIPRDIKVNGYWILKKTISEVEGQFFLITLHHSLEHMSNQLDVMRQVKRLLVHGGVCLLRLPIVGKAWEKYGVNWVELDAPRHFYLHSPKSLELLADKAGMEIFDRFSDTTEFEFIGSEQYLRDIPLMSERSYYVNECKSIFNEQQVRAYREEAEKLNEAGEGSRSGFYLRHRS